MSLELGLSSWVSTHSITAIASRLALISTLHRGVYVFLMVCRNMHGNHAPCLPTWHRALVLVWCCE